MLKILGRRQVVSSRSRVSHKNSRKLWEMVLRVKRKSSITFCPKTFPYQIFAIAAFHTSLLTLMILLISHPICLKLNMCLYISKTLTGKIFSVVRFIASDDNLVMELLESFKVNSKKLNQI